MGVVRTRTIKNKHATAKSGIKHSKDASKKAPLDGVTRDRKGTAPKHTRPLTLAELKKKAYKRRTFTAQELGIPELNKITPVGVAKPKGQKKGKVFVDDPESMSTIMALVQADKEGQIESKIMKARQMEEIREARKAEQERKDALRKEKLEQAKDQLRRKRKRNTAGGRDDDFGSRDAVTTGSQAKKSKQRVSFA